MDSWGKRVGGWWFDMWILLWGFEGGGGRDVGCCVLWKGGFWVNVGCGCCVFGNGGYGCCVLQGGFDSKRDVDEVGGAGGDVTEKYVFECRVVGGFV